ncbi:MAG: hypothetical protein ACKVJG_23740 [Candidatus Latescibacterota bacterium]
MNIIALLICIICSEGDWDMSEGRPGDHPLTDMLYHGSNIMGDEGDVLIRNLVESKGLRYAKDWFEKKLYQVPYDRVVIISELHKLNEDK